MVSEPEPSIGAERPAIPCRVRNRDAPILYAIFGGAYAIVTVGSLFTPQRWKVLGFVVILAVFLARYLLPTSAVLQADAITFRWPLRRVTVTAANLVTARVVTGSGPRTLALRRARSVRWGVIPQRWDRPVALAATLSDIITAAPSIAEQDKTQALAWLRR